MPTLSRLELKPSPREFDGEKFREYIEILKLNDIRSKLFRAILSHRDFDEIREINGTDKEKADLEINQCLIELWT